MTDTAPVDRGVIAGGPLAQRGQLRALARKMKYAIIHP